MDTTRFFPLKDEEIACTTCGCTSDCASTTEGTPKDGDISICMYCAQVRRFVIRNEALVGYAPMTDEEIAALDEETRDLVARYRSTYAVFLERAVAQIRAKDPATLTPGEEQMLRTAETVLKEPAATGAAPVGLDLTGRVFAWKNDEPVFLRMPQSDKLYLAVFSSARKLKKFHSIAHAPFKSIKQIENGPEFLTSFVDHPQIVVIVDPYVTEQGRVRFLQVAR